MYPEKQDISPSCKRIALEAEHQQNTEVAESGKRHMKSPCVIHQQDFGKINGPHVSA